MVNDQTASQSQADKIYLRARHARGVNLECGYLYPLVRIFRSLPFIVAYVLCPCKGVVLSGKSSHSYTLVLLARARTQLTIGGRFFEKLPTYLSPHFTC